MEKHIKWAYNLGKEHELQMIKNAILEILKNESDNKQQIIQILDFLENKANFL